MKILNTETLDKCNTCELDISSRENCDTVLMNSLIYFNESKEAILDTSLSYIALSCCKGDKAFKTLMMVNTLHKSTLAVSNKHILSLVGVYSVNEIKSILYAVCYKYNIYSCEIVRRTYTEYSDITILIDIREADSSYKDSLENDIKVLLDDIIGSKFNVILKSTDCFDLEGYIGDQECVKLYDRPILLTKTTELIRSIEILKGVEIPLENQVTVKEFFRDFVKLLIAMPDEYKDILYMDLDEDLIQTYTYVLVGNFDDRHIGEYMVDFMDEVIPMLETVNDNIMKGAYLLNERDGKSVEVEGSVKSVSY